MAETEIEWTDATWNPVAGHVDGRAMLATRSAREGELNCQASIVQARFASLSALTDSEPSEALYVKAREKIRTI
jgi:protein gp37